ncbi:FtsW/RodA/SpoVE family cell cycle protein [Listeria seeligeri]|uniref:FtsW/RodA/SpoVE family cell cycle protein n=1 Tax=Listeria seeligeri TaxID=1640 RepID=UPI0016292F86|nr:FtsW/RodA/SpoVE family cell cycle protein [Listeria seeligeri]MBC1941175.1 FtsW/RodA/SpoVE family cell cycle protein [Listeria seeligeri]
MKRELLYNRIILFVFLLSLVGCVAIYYAQQTNQYNTNFVGMQLVFLTIGVAACFGVSRLSVEFLRHQAIWLYLVMVILLLGILIPNPLVQNINGATRWYRFGGFSMQPSEITKSIFIFVLAHFAVKFEAQKWKQLGILAVLTGVVLLLIMKQPDLGTTIVYGITALAIILLAIKSTKLMVSLITVLLGVAATGMYLVVYHISVLEKLGFHAYQFARIQAWLDPTKNPDSVYQLNLSMKAVGSGMLTGSSGTNAYIPESHTDMIFSTIGHQFGFIGVSVLLILFMLLIHQLIMAALMMKNTFSSLVLAGFAVSFAFNIFENIGMTIGLMPLTGIPLPFISYGGSSVLGNFIAIGVVLAVIRSDANLTE